MIKTLVLDIKRAYKAVYRQGLTVDEAMQKISEAGSDAAELTLFTDFIKNSSRGIIR